MDMTGYKGKVAEVIAEHGWMIQGVGAEVPFAYTVGLTEYGHPELLMRGLPFKTMQGLLNDLAQPVKEHGRRYQPGERVPEIIRDYDVLLHGPIDPRDGELFQAIYLYGQIDALQVLWPDRDGRFPGEAGFDLPIQARAALL